MPSLEDKHTLIYLLCTTSSVDKGPQTVTRTAEHSTREKVRSFEMTQKESTKAESFAMQNHIGGSVGGGWWSVEASHDHQYSNSSSSAKKSKSEKEKMLDQFSSDSVTKHYPLGKKQVFVEYMEVQLHCFTAPGKTPHFLHQPLGATVAGPMDQSELASLAESYWMEKRSWRLILNSIGMAKVASGLTSFKDMEGKLSPKTYKPQKVASVSCVPGIPDGSPFYLASAGRRYYVHPNGGRAKYGAMLLFNEQIREKRLQFKAIPAGSGKFYLASADKDCYVHTKGGKAKTDANLLFDKAIREKRLLLKCTKTQGNTFYLDCGDGRSFRVHPKGGSPKMDAKLIWNNTINEGRLLFEAVRA